MTGVSMEQARLLHTMLRVKNLERSIRFYCQFLGMKQLRQFDFADARFSLVYLGYDSDRHHAVLELTVNWDETTDYTHGSGYGHIGIGVSDICALCEQLAAEGVRVLRHPGEMMSSGINIAFIEDPDGYKIELIELPFPPSKMGEHETLGS